MSLTYEALLPLQISAEPSVLEECARLYSEHYGTWSNSHPNVGYRGKNIKLSAKKLNEWFNNNASSLYLARNEENKIIGYAIAFNAKEKNAKKNISWVSQLVVHKDYRNSDVAKNLLYSIWGESKNYAWGIISANPYAIRALEKATRRRCKPICILKDIDKIKTLCIKYLPYVNEESIFFVNTETATLNTQFFVDHNDVPDMIKNVTSLKTPWTLGDLKEGWEWIGVTFNRQEQIKLSATELKEMIDTSDMVTKKAYSRMLITSNQKWMSHTHEEIDYIIKNLSLSVHDTVYDFGCGIGRHVIELNKRGFNAYGIDYLECNIEAAKENANRIGMEGDSIFHIDDCRTTKLNKPIDAIICVYDVIGSFVDDESNEKIIQNINDNLKSGGRALITVMNYEMTQQIATQKFSFVSEPNKLLQLEASQTMEQTGNVFDPKYFILDDTSHIVYRKERFEHGGLPIELIVRDRRFSKEEICNMCEKHGLKIEQVRYVNASDWTIERNAFDKKAKEILLICKKD